MNYLLIRLPIPILIPFLKLLITTTIASPTDMLTHSLSTLRKLHIQKLMLGKITSGCTMRKLSVRAAHKMVSMRMALVMRIMEVSNMSIMMKRTHLTTKHSNSPKCLPMKLSDRFPRSSDTRSKCPMEHTPLIPYTMDINTDKSKCRLLKLSLNSNSQCKAILSLQSKRRLLKLSLNSNSQCKAILSLLTVVNLSNSTHSPCRNSNTVHSHKLHR